MPVYDDSRILAETEQQLPRIVTCILEALAYALEADTGRVTIDITRSKKLGGLHREHPPYQPRVVAIRADRTFPDIVLRRVLTWPFKYRSLPAALRDTVRAIRDGSMPIIKSADSDE